MGDLEFLASDFSPGPVPTAVTIWTLHSSLEVRVDLHFCLSTGASLIGGVIFTLLEKVLSAFPCSSERDYGLSDLLELQKMSQG